MTKKKKKERRNNNNNSGHSIGSAPGQDTHSDWTNYPANIINTDDKNILSIKQPDFFLMYTDELQ